ncbi:hypothetical protein [Marivita hallyeonensis]|uniref:PH domain-containing protein n=1 Tax=Marivita hallyeonensis TaxID=996342 RepID=A0A1M5W218_9RHOB|nr:hypothetical protein [Marivita hallyeonensis]SHH81480.1 hypothetical protein SAMN05443551_3204 [Marivita hallyeonensis]
MILEHEVSARRPKALVAIALVWLGLWGVWVGLDAAPWILVLLGLFTLPAIFEAARGDVARLTLDDTRLTWRSERHSGDAPLKDIDHVRFDTRLDLAVNARLELVNGTVLRLPVECVPRYDIFCAALDDAGIRHERHHFSFF